MLKESCGGIKQYQTKKAEMNEAAIPAVMLPIWALKNTAGKKRNQTNGLMNGQRIH